MKYNIPKLQGGGFATFTPYIPSAPAPTAPSTGAQTTKTQAASSILDEDTYKELVKEGGLINDVNAFVEKLARMESSQSMPYLNSNNRATSIRMIGEINQLKRSKENWSEAIKTASAKGGLNEVAIGGSGEVFTKTDNGSIQALTLDTYKKQTRKGQLLTVAELMNERQLNPQLVGKNDLFSVANNAVGIDTITDHIKGLITALGTETTSDSRFWSKEQAQEIKAKQIASLGGKQPTQSELDSITSFQKIIDTPGGYAQLTQEHSTERAHANKALDYIWGTLGISAQKKLAATAIMNGQDNPRQYLMEMILAGTDEKVSNNITAKELPGTSASDKSRSLTQYQLFHKDKLMTPNTTFALNDPKYGILFRGAIGGVSPIITTDGENVGMNTISTILSSGYNQIVKGDEVFFGSKKVDQGNLNNIIYDGQDAAKVYMPTTNNGEPDYKAFAEFKDIYAVYDANKANWSARQSEGYFKQHGYNLQIDEVNDNGTIGKVIRDNKYVKPFLVMYGYTNDATSLVDDNQDWLIKLTNQEEKSIVPQLEQIWTVGKGKAVKNLTPSKFLGEDYYKGMVAIPYKPEAAAIIDAQVHQGPKDNISVIGDIQRNLKYSSNQPLNPNISGSIINK